MDCPPEKVAVVEKWPLVEVQLYFKYSFEIIIKRNQASRERNKSHFYKGYQV